MALQQDNKEDNKRVPKIIHQIWIDTKDEFNPEPSVPQKYEQFMSKWRQMHPDYEYKLWNGKTIKDYIDTHFKDVSVFFYNLPTWIYRCDLFRYLVLEREGGIYIDADMEPVKDISHLVAYITPGVHAAVLGYEKGNQHISNAIIASAPGSGLWVKFAQRCVDDVITLGVDKLIKTIEQEFVFQNWNTKDWHDTRLMQELFPFEDIVRNGCVGVLDTVGVYKLTDFLHSENAIGTDGRKPYIVEDSRVLYPWSLAMTSTERTASSLSDATIAIHHFSSSWFYTESQPYHHALSPGKGKEEGQSHGGNEGQSHGGNEGGAPAPAPNWIKEMTETAKVVRIVEPRRRADMYFYQGDVFTSNMTMWYNAQTDILYAAVKQHNQCFPLGSRGKTLFWTVIWEMCPQTYTIKRIVQFPPNGENCIKQAQGRQDPRIYVDTSASSSSPTAPYLLSNIHGDNELFQVRVQKLDPSFMIAKELQPSFLNMPHLNEMHQKNWCPFYHGKNKEVLFMVDVYPEMVISKLDSETGVCSVLYNHCTKNWIEPLLDEWCPEYKSKMGVHGATNLVHIPELKMFFGAIQLKNKQYIRYNQIWFAIKDSPPFTPVGCSRPFRLDTLVGLEDDWDVIFFPGLERIGNKLVGSFSQNDERMIMFEMPYNVTVMSQAIREYPYLPPQQRTEQILTYASSSGQKLLYRINGIKRVCFLGFNSKDIKKTFAVLNQNVNRTNQRNDLLVCEQPFDRNDTSLLKNFVSKNVLDKYSSREYFASLNMLLVNNPQKFVNSLFSLHEQQKLSNQRHSTNAARNKVFCFSISADNLTVQEIESLIVSRNDTAIVLLVHDPPKVSDYTTNVVTEWYNNIKIACFNKCKPLVHIKVNDDNMSSDGIFEAINNSYAID